MFLKYFDSLIELFLLNPIAQTSGLIWMICVWIAFLYKDDLKTIKMLFIANIFWWILFIWLESYSGLVAVMISALRLYLSMKYKKNIKVFWFLIILIVITWILSYDSYYSLLPILWSLIWAYSFIYFSWIILRIWCLFISITWLMYGVCIWSIWWIINEFVVEILILITIYNYIWINGYKTIFISKIKSILHPHMDIDFWRYTIVKDKEQINRKYNIKEKLKRLIRH
jgi:hypothetical protein